MAMISSLKKIIIFDLDDTLLDTQRSLIPLAVKESCEKMIEAGLSCSLEECQDMREELFSRGETRQFFKKITDTYSPEVRRNRILGIGREAFYEREVPDTITLAEGARDLLEQLKPKYHLLLVTAGDEMTQSKKIKILRLQTFFEEILFMPDFTSEGKLIPFRAINDHFDLPPDQFLSVGNRLDTDIRPAKHLGWKTCWVKTGEHLHMLPKNELEVPDYQIDQIRDLIRVCQL